MRLNRSIILEGPDGSGKSVLRTILTEKWGLPDSGHDGGPPKSAEDVWERYAWFAVQSPTVRDRCPAISDYVYAEVMQRDPKVPLNVSNAWLAVLSPAIIYCRPPEEAILMSAVIVKPHKPAADVEAVKAQRPKIIQAYDRMIPWIASYCGLPVFYHDWTTDESAEGLRKRLIEGGVLCAD
jgi:hypothetical protein